MNRLAAVTLLLALATGALAESPGDQDLRVLVIGTVHESLEGRFAQLRPIADYMGAALQAQGIARVDIMVVEDRRRLARMMRDGRVDWVSASAADAVYLQEAAGAEILARAWKQGAPQIRTVFFARVDSGIASLDDLHGEMVGLAHPDSTTGHFLPVAELMHKGYRTVALDTPRQRVPGGLVGLSFAGSNLNTTTWVHKRIVAAGVLSNLDWESDDSMPPSFRKDFVIFHQTDPLPRGLELVRSDIGPQVRAALKKALLAMDEDPAAAAALQAYQGTLRFDELEAQDWSVMTEMRSTFAQLIFVN